MYANKIILQLKREIWEHRFAFFWGPISGILLPMMIAFAVFYYGPESMLAGRIDMQFDNSHIKDFVVPANERTLAYYDFHKEGAFKLFAHATAGISIIAFFFVYAVIALNYAFGSLFADRKGRDILFWRSLPVSETRNILGKLSVLCLYLPVKIIVTSFVAWLVILLGGAAYAGDVGLVWQWLPHGTVSMLMGFGVIFLFVLCFLPFLSWALMVSALVKNHPGTLGVLIPTLLVVADALIQRYWGVGFGLKAALHFYLASIGTYFEGRDGEIANWFSMQSGLWGILLISLSVSLVFLGAALWLRNSRYEI